MGCNSPGATHHAACDCRESEWAARLAAAEKRAEKAEATVAHIESVLPRLTGYTIEQIDAMDDAALAGLLAVQEAREKAERELAAEEMRAALRMRESQSWCGRVACDEVRSKGWTLLAALSSSPAAPAKDEVLIVCPKCGRNGDGACDECGGHGATIIHRDVKPETAPAPSEAVRDPIRTFGLSVLAAWWDEGNPTDLDGSDLQEFAERAGLWHQVARHADGVECEWCGNDGSGCGELTEDGERAWAEAEGLAAPRREPANGGE